MKNRHNLCAMLALAISLTSCGGGESSGTNSGAVLTSLNGTWRSDCFLDPVFLPGASLLVSGTFNSGAVTIIGTTYDNATCNGNISMQETLTGTYILGSAVTVDGSVAGITTATKIDYTETTAGSPDFGEITYDLVAIKDNKLYQGDTDGVNDGATEMLRATQLDGQIVFTRDQ